jgi:hypothetical protein
LVDEGWLLRCVATGRSLMSIGMLITRLMLLSILMTSMLLLWLMTWPRSLACLVRYGGALLKRLVVFLRLHSLSYSYSYSYSRSGFRTFRRPVPKSETPIMGMIITFAGVVGIAIENVFWGRKRNLVRLSVHLRCCTRWTGYQYCTLPNDHSVKTSIKLLYIVLTVHDIPSQV